LKRSRLPHHSTYRRILETVLDGEEFERVMGAFIAQRPEVGQGVVIAIDGKTLRGTITQEDPCRLHLLAAYLPGEGLCCCRWQTSQRSRRPALQGKAAHEGREKRRLFSGRVALEWSSTRG